MYNALLKFEFSSHMKLLALAYDRSIVTKVNTPSEEEVFANSKLSKIEK
jgi:hypothetical protein